MLKSFGNGRKDGIEIGARTVGVVPRLGIRLTTPATKVTSTMTMAKTENTSRGILAANARGRPVSGGAAGSTTAADFIPSPMATAVAVMGSTFYVLSSTSWRSWGQRTCVRSRRALGSDEDAV